MGAAKRKVTNLRAAAWVESLVWKLRSHIKLLHSAAKKKKKRERENKMPTALGIAFFCALSDLPGGSLEKEKDRRHRDCLSSIQFLSF